MSAKGSQRGLSQNHILKRLPSQRCAGLGRDTEEKVGSLALETCREDLGSHLFNVQSRDYFPGGGTRFCDI